MREVFKRFLRGFRFSNVVLLKRTTFENLWKTSKRFLKGSRSPKVFQRFFRGFWSTFFVYFRCYGAHGFGFKTWNRVLFFYVNSWSTIRKLLDFLRPFLIVPETRNIFFRYSVMIFRIFRDGNISCQYTKNVDQKPLKNLWKTSGDREPFKNLLEVFQRFSYVCCPFQKDNIWKPKTCRIQWILPKFISKLMRTTFKRI